MSEDAQEPENHRPSDMLRNAQIHLANGCPDATKVIPRTETGRTDRRAIRLLEACYTLVTICDGAVGVKFPT